MDIAQLNKSHTYDKSRFGGSFFVDYRKGARDSKNIKGCFWLNKKISAPVVFTFGDRGKRLMKKKSL